VNTSEILRKLSKRSIVVGSSASGTIGNDIDLLISEKAWPLVQKIAKESIDKDSAFPLNWKIWDSDIPLDIFVVWYGPTYEDVNPSHLKEVELLGVKMTAYAPPV
jgi:hypothetical protein